MIDEISVIVPVYNEVETVGRVVTQIVEALNPLFSRYEVLVVNDGSDDGTTEIVNRLAAGCENIKVINLERNSGKGAALREGFKNARFEYIFFTDSDGQFNIGEIVKIMPLIDRCDMVACYRLERMDDIKRRISSVLFNRFVAILFGIRFRDINCAFKLFKRGIIGKIDLQSQGFAIDAELLWKTSRAGFKICEHGVNHYKRDKGSSKMGFKGIGKTLMELLRIRF